MRPLPLLAWFWLACSLSSPVSMNATGTAGRTYTIGVLGGG